MVERFAYKPRNKPSSAGVCGQAQGLVLWALGELGPALARGPLVEVFCQVSLLCIKCCKLEE